MQIFEVKSLGKWISDSCSTVFEIIDLLPLILLKSAQKLFLLLSTFQLQQHISKLWNFTCTQICRNFFEGNMKRGDLKPCYLKSITTTGATASQQKKRRTTEGNWCDVSLCPSIKMMMVIMMMTMVIVMLMMSREQLWIMGALKPSPTLVSGYRRWQFIARI